jgi:sulfur relay protein TusB/DsrH
LLVTAFKREVKMLVIIKSSPDTPEGKRAVKLARDMAADICLIQNAVYFAQRERLEGFCGTVYLLDEDRKLRGLGEKVIEKDIKKIDYDSLIELMIKEDNVIGVF